MTENQSTQEPWESITRYGNVDLTLHPILRECFRVACLIERCGASEPLTLASSAAFDLCAKVQGVLRSDKRFFDAAWRSTEKAAAERDRLRTALENVQTRLAADRSAVPRSELIEECERALGSDSETPPPASNQKLRAPSQHREILPFDGGRRCFVPEAYAWELWQEIEHLQAQLAALTAPETPAPTRLQRIETAARSLVDVLPKLCDVYQEELADLISALDDGSDLKAGERT